jgi:hypothetical protein
VIDQALQGKQGQRTDLVDNVNEVERPTGNSESAALRRLRKDRPDLHAQVLDDRLSDDDLVVVPINRLADPFGTPEYIECSREAAAHWDMRVWRERP